MQGTNWAEVQKILSGLDETSPESVRHVVRAYMTKVALGSKKPEQALAILEAFSKPFNPYDGISPLVLACGQLIFGN